MLLRNDNRGSAIERDNTHQGSCRWCGRQGRVWTYTLVKVGWDGGTHRSFLPSAEGDFCSLECFDSYHS